jgi:hypothetical protein
MRNGVEWDVIDAEAPYKVVNVSYVLLMGFRSEEGFK